MDEVEFWRLIGASRRQDREGQVEALRAELRRLPPAEVAEFGRQFARQHRRAYTWELWGAAHIINGGCSDDGFEYFRSWLISLGREAFERALADPGSLAELPDTLRARDDDEGVSFEELAHIAGEVHEEQTGGPIPDGGSTILVGQEPAGVEWTEDGDDLQRRFPGLWARFGEAGPGPAAAGERPATKRGCLGMILAGGIALFLAIAVLAARVF